MTSNRVALALVALLVFLVSLFGLNRFVEKSEKTDNLAAVSGLGTWHDSMSSSEAAVAFDGNSSFITFVQNGLSLPAGTVTGLRVYMKSLSYAQGLTVGLYDASGNRVVSARASGSTGTNFWQELDADAPIAIQAGTYKVALQFNGNASDFQFGGVSGQPSGTTYVGYSCSYAESPCATLPAAESNLTNSFAVGVYLEQAGGGGGATDTQSPVISAVTSGSVSQSSAVISWSTNEAADTQVEYGLTAAYGNSTALNTSLSTSHSATLSSLSANTTYNYRVKSKDAAGNLATSGNNTFTTQASGQEPQTPSTYSLSVSKSGTGSGTVSGGSISCGSSCSQSGISSGTQIILTATAASGSTFTGWSGACSGTGSCVMSITTNTSVTAMFGGTGASAPSAPEFVAAVGVASNQVSITWPTIDGETTSTIYTLYRNGTAIATKSRDSIEVYYKEPSYHQDKGLSPNTTYTYTVTAKNGSSGTESAPTSPVSATTKSSSSGIVPVERLADWTPGVTVGVPGGIKTRTNTINVTSAPYNADNTGSTDASSAINAAIAAAQAEDVVYMPAGTYRIDNAIMITKGNITLRGAGRDSTVIDCRVPSICVKLRGNDLYSATYTPTSGTGKGSTVIGMSDTSMLSQNQMIEIGVRNDMSLPVISPYGYEYLRRQMAIVKSKTANSITISPPIIAGSTASKTLITPTYFSDPVPYVGFEDFTIDGKNGSAQDGLNISTSYGTWVVDVRLKNVKNYNLKIANALNCEIRHSFVDILNHPKNQPSGAGFLMDSSTGCLIEDNIFATGGAATTLFSHGNAGNVISYNFLTSGEMNTNHGAQNGYNLYEGNITDNVKSDGYYGGESETTWFRNWVSGKYVDPFTNVVTPTFTFAIKRWSRNFNLIGNIVGSSGVSSGGFSFGQPNMGNASFTGWAAPSAGKYWLDWGLASGLGIKGTVTSRTSDSEMVINLTSGRDRLYNYYLALCGCSSYVVTADWGTGARYAMSVTSFSGNSITLNAGYPGPGSIPSTLPSAGTEVGIWPRAEGFQERDLDTITTSILKGNYLASASGGGAIPAHEALGSETLQSSLYLDSKPSWFGTLAWPPFSPLSPNQSYAAIPAGYRYLNGGEAPGVTNPGGNPVPTSFTLTVSKAGTGSGTLTGTGISCGADCSQSGLSSGAQVTLTAAAASGSTFAGWSGGGCSGTTSTCTITVSTNTTVVATFNSNSISTDTTLPTISITAPVGGATVSGTVSIAATATDNIGVVGVQWKLDGANLGSELTVAPYSGAWNTAGVSNGSHSLTATVRDAAGNTRTATTTITVSNAAATTGGGSSNTTTTGSSGGGSSSGGSSAQVTTPANATTTASRLGVFTPTVPQKQPALATVCASGNAVFKRTLVIGSSGEDVRDLQKLLNAQGFVVTASGPGSKGSESNYYGPATAAAVKRFQEANRAETLAPAGLFNGTGIWGPLSQKKGNSLLPCANAQTASQTIMTPAAASSFIVALDIGSQGGQVILLQTLLSKLPNIYPEKLVTGMFGPLTQKAVGKFQELYGLAKPGDTAYGFVGPKTRAKLNEVLKTVR